MRRKREIFEEDCEINISPLIDMVFILLIFFIVTTVFVEEPGVEVNKASAFTVRDFEKESLLIAITAENTVVYGGREIGLGGIRPLVRRFGSGDELPVVLIVDEKAHASMVVRAVDEAKLGGAEDVGISTEKL